MSTTGRNGMRRIAAKIGVLLLATLSLSPPLRAQRAVLLYVIDGLQLDAARVAMNSGAENMKYLYENGAWAKEAYCTSPEARVVLPDDTRPWGNASPPNVAMHTGTHIFESKEIDDVFLSAQKHGIRSVFAGSAENYSVINTSTFSLSLDQNDSLVVAFVIDKLLKDSASLLSVHVQQLRRTWKGPVDELRPDSPYISAVVEADRLLGTIIDALKSRGLWDSTFVIITSDHGMGQTERSDHPSSVRSSWETYLNFYGPGIRKGVSIPYAESPDIALFIAHVLRLSPLAGHTGGVSDQSLRPTTGVLPVHVFENGPESIEHPMYIRRFLESHSWSAPESYAAYREAMIAFVGSTTH